jgi:3-oxoacyl-[acyl-carrier protein] reductase
MKINEEVVLITGALSDIGKAIAENLFDSGYSVLINYRNNNIEAENFLKQFNESERVKLIKADIRLHDQVIHMFDEAYKIFSNVDVLINNAGINRDISFLEMTDDQWKDVTSTILSGTFFCSQEFSRRYKGIDGNIINIGAVTAFKGRKNGANYCSARAGVIALTKCIAQELAPKIRVNTITPGRIRTKELLKRYKSNGNDLDKSVSDIPLSRLGNPADIARMINFIIQKDNYVTGQNFMVDGGLYMR